MKNYENLTKLYKNIQKQANLTNYKLVSTAKPMAKKAYLPMIGVESSS